MTNGKMQERELEGIDTQNRKVVDDLFSITIGNAKIM